MNIKLLSTLLGKPVQDILLANLFASENIYISNLVIEEDEFRTNLDLHAKNIELVFTAENWFLGLEGPIGEGRKFFSGIFIKRNNDFDQVYDGWLPQNLSFLDNYLNVIHKLGIPDWKRIGKDGDAIAHRWDNLEKFSIHITFKQDYPMIISLSIKDRRF